MFCIQCFEMFWKRKRASKKSIEFCFAWKVDDHCVFMQDGARAQNHPWISQYISPNTLNRPADPQKVPTLIPWIISFGQG